MGALGEVKQEYNQDWIMGELELCEPL